jgi:hypothetical protein
MFEGFENKEDVCSQFNIGDFDGVIVLAIYDQGSYDGTAEVIYVHGGKFYMASGSHCSCYGLEDQWNPVEMPVEGIEKIIAGGGLLSGYKDWLLKVIAAYERLDLFNASSDEVDVALKFIVNT